MSINKEVIFTKPVYHLPFSISDVDLKNRVESFFIDHGFYIRSKQVDADSLKSNQTMISTT